MAEDIEDILGEIAVRTGILLDLTNPSPELVQFFAEMATYINTLAVATYGGRKGHVREEGLLQQVIGATLQTFADVDPHPTAFDKAAMLLRGITAGHPFQDGNKRTGFLIAVFYLEQRGYPLPEEFSSGLTAEQAADIERFLTALTYWDISRQAAMRAGQDRYSFARQGVTITTTDALLAAVAREHRATLVTSNLKDFPMTDVTLLSIR